MHDVTAENAADYLRDSGRVPPGRAVSVREMSGGVSNIVLRVDVDGEPPIVLKQSRERLRTRMEWVSRLDRIWTERAAMDLLAEILPPGIVPAVRFDDPENYLFAMRCAPDESVVWKAQLLAGHVDPEIGRRLGAILGTVHDATAGHPALSGRLADTTLFDQLRIDPYYRTIARVHADLGPRIDALIASMAETRPARLVLGDFSPKNILVHPGGLTVLDFETAHAGDPAFDLGFFLSHLLLKAFRAAPSQRPYLDLIDEFRSAYRARAGDDDARDRRAGLHTAACVLARLDGKSPVDYLDDLDRDAVRRFARSALLAGPDDWEGLLGLLAREMQ